jgi:IclR family mhp operon transcriptional activator
VSGQTLQGLKRGLLVLRALNECDVITALELSRKTGLPRTSVYRVLETLVETGYVTGGTKKGSYQLTIQVRSLSDGFNDEAWVLEVGSPVLQKLGKQIVWPTVIGTFNKDSMLLRENTHDSSPLSIDSERMGYRTPMLMSSLGLAYLAWSPPDERELILKSVAASKQPDATLARDSISVDNLLAQVIKRGYGFREGGISPNTGSIAVPVIWQNRVIACINLNYILTALSEKEVADRYLSPMKEAAVEIQTRLNTGRYQPAGHYS